MNFLELAKQRYSCRKFSSKDVEHSKIGLCLEAARLAPSACNSQPWHFIIVQDPSQRDKLAQAAWLKVSQFNNFNAPVFAVIVVERSTILSQVAGWLKKKPFYLLDIGMAAEHFCLQATELGLGSCMLGWFREKNVKKLLKVPFYKRVALMIALGYPQENTIPEKKRKRETEIISFEKYN